MLTLTSPVETPFHHWPAGCKLGLLAGLGFAVGMISSPAVLGAVLVGLWLAYTPFGWVEAARLPRRLWPLWPFVVVIGGWHLARGTPQTGLAIALRMLIMFAAASLMLLTTRFDAILATFSKLMRPLERFHFPVARAAFALAMAVRFVPVLAKRASDLSVAWRARSSRKPYHRLLTPLTLAALDEAERAAEALRARSALV